jgi:hypothetical protein
MNLPAWSHVPLQNSNLFLPVASRVGQSQTGSHPLLSHQSPFSQQANPLLLAQQALTGERLDMALRQSLEEQQQRAIAAAYHFQNALSWLTVNQQLRRNVVGVPQRTINETIPVDLFYGMQRPIDIYVPPRQQIVLQGLLGTASSEVPFPSVVAAPPDCELQQQDMAQVEENHSSTSSVTSLSLPALMYRPSDDEYLSEYQIFLRQNVEYFEADRDDVANRTPGRHKDVFLGQVGIRCSHCSGIPARRRTTGTAYFPSSLERIYQLAQNIGKVHFSDGNCESISRELHATFKSYRPDGRKASASQGGRQYWETSARAMGIVSRDEGGLVFSPPNNEEGS